MKLTGLHILLTYQCTFECDHCFVWGSPWQSGVLTLEQIQEIYRQAGELGSVEWIYFEGGEAFLYYAVLLEAVREAASLGFKVGVVSNAYWATGLQDAAAWLKPFTGLLDKLTVSSDLFHYKEEYSRQAQNAQAAARELGIPTGMIQVDQPEEACGVITEGQLEDESGVMYRGRAVKMLAGRAPHRLWSQFTACVNENLREPGRVHLDPLGNVHLCQGISLGNVFQTPLATICRYYDPDSHPIAGPILAGGPAELAQRYGVSPDESYADSCHLCYQTRLALRPRFPDILGPDQRYGVY